jgi:parallel beta-helix repeat protein
MKRFTRAALSIAVALGMLATVPAAVFAAQPNCGDTIYVNTTLTADMDCTGLGSGAAIYMGRKGITLNLNGHTIWGPTGSDGAEGVDTNYKKHTTVKNGTISDFQEGIYANQSVGGTFKNLDIHCDNDDNYPDGVYVSYGVGNILNNITIDSWCYVALDFYGSAENWVTNNNITEATYGIYSEYDSNDHVSGNYFEYTYAGIYDDYSSHNVYSSNRLNGDELGASYGFYLDCDDYGWVKLLNNETWGNQDYGFYTYYCYDDSNEQYGSTITGNSSHDNVDGGYGFYDDYSINTTWSGNSAKRNDSFGFYFDTPGLVAFNNNVANHNGDDGIYAYENYGTGYGNFASFRNNIANYNEDYGINADYGIANASGNTAHNNGNSPDDCYNVDCNQ